jgi:hypothetical protein
VYHKHTPTSISDATFTSLKSPALAYVIVGKMYQKLPTALAMFLTEDGILSTPGLARSPIHVEVCMSVGPPLAQNARACVDHIYEVSVSRVKVMRSVAAHEEQDGGVQTCQHTIPAESVRKPVDASPKTTGSLSYC